MPRTVLPLLILLVLAGCGPSADKILGERRSVAEPKLAKIDAAGKAALDYAAEPADWKMPDGEKLRFGDNAALLQTETFATGEDRKPSLDLIFSALWLQGAREMLGTGVEGTHPDFVSATLDTLDSMKYLVLVRTRMYAEPSVSNAEQFSPGWWQGEVLVFEIESAKCLGVIALEATNSDEVTAKLSDPDKWLHSDLWSNTRKAIADALAPYTDGDVLK